MKQILQNLANGEISILEAPSPHNLNEHLIINTTLSLISAGTERMLVDFGRASMLDKIRQQPEKVKMVLEKIHTDGLLATYDAVRTKLNQPLALGYCNVGVIHAVGQNAGHFKIGERVVSNGAHADVVRVSKNLCAKIPSNVSDEAASFVVLMSIGLQGIRLAAPTLGEAFVVIGTGLIGLLTIQLLRAQGCRVLAIDFDANKLELAKQFGAEICHLPQQDAIACGLAFSRGRGVDGVIITAATKSNDPVSQAAQMSRKRGRIILVGVTGLELNRADFYEKELIFQVSCSYGPGRYDEQYEKEGVDYPFGFVRWTEQRNFEACLDMLANGQINVEPLITHRYLFEEANQAYQALVEDKHVLGILLQYSSNNELRNSSEVLLQTNEMFNPTQPIVGFVGAGNYASRVLIPAFKKAKTQCHTIISTSGTSSVIHGKQHGFIKAASTIETMLRDKSVNTVVVTTRHDSHAELVVKALNAGKNVFVEKPLALDLMQLSAIEAAYHTATLGHKKLHLMVGFNRRFAPHVQKIKTLLKTVNEPKSIMVTVNAGMIPSSHWVQDPAIGGGRIIGEACHFIDLMRYLVGAPIISVKTQAINDKNVAQPLEDRAVIVLGFADGSFGTVHYLANGAASFPKERVEIFTAGRILQLDNFRKLKGFGWPGFKTMNLWQQDKGQQNCVKEFLNAIEQGTNTPISIQEIFEIGRISIEAAELIKC